MLLVYVIALVASGWRAHRQTELMLDLFSVWPWICHTPAPPSKLSYTVFQWNLGVRVSQHSKKRTP